MLRKRIYHQNVNTLFVSFSSSVPQEIHEKCGVCDGTGVMYESRIKGPDVKKKCSGCSGRGYKIRYK